MRSSHVKPGHFSAPDLTSSRYFFVVSYVINYSALLFRVILNKDPPTPSQLLMNRLLCPKAFTLMLLMCLSGVSPKPCGL